MSESNWDHLAKARELRGESGPVRNPYQRWLDGNTRKTAIEAFCMNCMGTDDPDDPPAGIRNDIRNCPSKSCPLYRWRPYK